MLFVKLEYDETGFVPVRVFGTIHIDSLLHVKLQSNGSNVPLPEFFRKGTDCRLTSLSSISELANHLKNIAENEPFPFIDELNSRRFYHPKGRPPYSVGLLRYCLLL